MIQQSHHYSWVSLPDIDQRVGGSLLITSRKARVRDDNSVAMVSITHTDETSLGS